MSANLANKSITLLHQVRGQYEPDRKNSEAPSIDSTL